MSRTCCGVKHLSGVDDIGEVVFSAEYRGRERLMMKLIVIKLPFLMLVILALHTGSD